MIPGFCRKAFFRFLESIESVVFPPSHRAVVPWKNESMHLFIHLVGISQTKASAFASTSAGADTCSLSALIYLDQGLQCRDCFRWLAAALHWWKHLRFRLRFAGLALAWAAACLALPPPAVVLLRNSRDSPNQSPIGAATVVGFQFPVRCARFVAPTSRSRPSST